MGWEPCGTTERSCRSCQRGGPYARPYFKWIPDPDDDEPDEPTRRDLKSLRQDLHGEVCKGLVPFDPRAGIVKRPNTTGGGYRQGGPRVGIAFREGMEPDDFELPDEQRGRTFFRVRRPSYRPITGSPLRGNSPGRTVYDKPLGFGNLFMFHTTLQDSQSAVTLPATLPVVPLAPKFGPMAATAKIVTIGPNVVRQFSCTRKEDGEQLKTVMGCSAFDAAENGGISPSGVWAWLHLIAYSLGGMDGNMPDVPGNLVAGTHAANIYRLAIESAVKKLALNNNHATQITVTFEGSYRNWGRTTEECDLVCLR